MSAEERIGKLERQTVRLRLLVVVLILGAGALSIRSALRGGESQAAANEIRARAFVLEDDRGRVRARLEMVEGGPALFMYDENGRQRVVLNADKDGAILSLDYANGKLGVAFMTSDELGSAWAALSSPDGTTRWEQGTRGR